MNSSGQTVIAAMVKARECCRRLVQTYEQARNASEPPVDGHIGLLRAADTTANRLLHYVRLLPRDVGLIVSGRDSRIYATRLRAEIRELLEKAVILERETRHGLSVGRGFGDGGPSYD